jgi:hypothetical protein
MPLEDDSKSISQQDSQLMDSLLHHCLQDEAASNSRRVDQLMDTLRDSPTIVAPNTSSRLRLSRWLPVPLAIATAALIFIAVQIFQSPNAAYAAIDRSIAAEASPVARQYAVTVKRRTKLGQIRTSDHTLYALKNRFAIRSKSLFGLGHVWIGGDENESWFVPRVGPVHVADPSTFRKSSAERRDYELPVLTISTVLSRIRRNYRLEFEDAATLPDMPDQNLNHVIAIRQSEPKSGKRPPTRIEFWAAPETGVVQQMQLQWDESTNQANGSNWIESTVKLTDTPELPDDFFDHTGHHIPDRRVIDSR